MIDITQHIDEKRLEDLLCNALEGGSNYWYRIEKYNFPPGQTKQSLGIEFTHLELPFKGGSLTISSDGDMPEANLDIDAIKKGIAIMAEKYPQHFADFISENDDATTGDVFLQCCLFGEVVFG